MALTWSFESLETPIFSATLCTLRVLVPVAVHLGDGGNEGAVHAPVALDHVVREEAAGAELRDAQRQRAGAGASDLSR